MASNRIADSRENNFIATPTLQTVNAVLLKLFDPQKLSPNEFDSQLYYTFLVETIARSFGISRVVLRQRDATESDSLNVIASFGLPVGKMRSLTVKVNRGISAVMQQTRESVYLPDLNDPAVPYLQKEFADDEGLRSALACPLFLADVFGGFVIYFKTAVDAFTDDERSFLGGPLNHILQNVFEMANQVARARDAYLSLRRDFASAVSALQISLHTAKNYLKTAEELSVKVAGFENRVEFKCESDRRDFRTYARYAAERTKAATDLLIATLTDQRSKELIRDFGTFVSETIEAVHFLFTRTTKVVERVPAVVVAFEGNKSEIEQIIISILMNSQGAIERAIESGIRHRSAGKIEVTVSAESGNAVLVIRDNGIGMTPEELQRVREDIPSRRSGGTGMGLRLCRKLLSNHSGRLEISSVAGEGTTVTMCFGKLYVVDEVS